MESNDGVSQEQVHDLIFSREIGWKDIIFDLINTEQLDPWDIDIGLLAEKYFEKVEELEELDFFVSSQVLLAASLLLRLKSEMILNKYISSIDDFLFNRDSSDEKRKNTYERIELDEEIPMLVMKSPIPRFKKVTLNQLIESLNKAIKTENRRIKKTIVNQNALRETGISLPKRKFSIANKMKVLRGKLDAHFDANKSHKKVPYSHFIGEEKEERALSFFPLLQLEMNGDVWLEQEYLFDEIHIWLKDVYLKHNPDPFEDLKMDENFLSVEEIERLKEVDDAEVL